MNFVGSGSYAYHMGPRSTPGRRNLRVNPHPFEPDWVSGKSSERPLGGRPPSGRAPSCKQESAELRILNSRTLFVNISVCAVGDD